MSLRERLAAELPLLRRYARALSGSQDYGDALVRELLEAALADSSLLEQIGAGRAELYTAFTRLWSASQIDDAGDGSGEGREAVAQRRLARVSPEHRQALLLTTIEGFGTSDAARILGIEPQEVDALVQRAVAEIEGETATDVLIIEDEPLIAMQLEGLVSDLGHTVIGTAATRSQAVELLETIRPGLVLADIQLADGSSGIDAVEDILEIDQVPVIFITAYPERLLTGERPEPTYLVTKPFREDTVRATISQALFFNPARIDV